MSDYDKIMSVNSLRSGFLQVKESDGTAGYDKQTIDNFEENLEKEIYFLNGELKYFHYKPKPVIFFEIPKTSGGKRLLSLYSVRDRVVQSAFMQFYSSFFEEEYEDESFGYRKGYSREALARKINKYYNDGCRWILDGDIKNYFDSVDHNILIDKVKKIIGDEDSLSLMLKWLNAVCIINKKKHTVKKGLLQGSVISPMLANLYLDKFDEKVKEHNYKILRYADDFIILTKEKSEAENALKLTGELLKELNLELNYEKTVITNFSNGFKFLGYIFLNSLIVPASAKDTSKPVDNGEKTISYDVLAGFFKNIKKENSGKLNEEKLKSSEIGSLLLEALDKKGMKIDDIISDTQQEEHPPLIEDDLTFENEFIDSDLSGGEEIEVTDKSEVKIPKANENLKVIFRTLYIQTQGSILRKEGERFIIIKGDKELLNIPALKISSIIIFGTCTITPSAIQYCIRKSIPVTLLSSRGKYYGSIDSTYGYDAELLRLQVFRSLEEKFSLGFSKNVILAKINNQIVFLQRSMRKEKDEFIESSIKYLKNITGKIENCESTGKIRGFEGISAVRYFNCFGRLFNRSKGFYNENFNRSKRPPLDPVNCILSFGYTLLASNVFSFIRARGLNPYSGYFHEIHSGHPALASDLMEEFRFLIDGMAVWLVNKGVMNNMDFYFEKEPGTACYLTKSGKEKVIRNFEQRMFQKVKHKVTGFTVDYRRCIDLQIQQLVQLIRGERENYSGFKIMY